ncbi:hypothetical protein ACFL5A_00185 [Gemmatimonadota bacterium]
MRTSILLILSAGACLAGAGCSPDESPPGAEDTITREAFVEAYVELRVAGLTTIDQEIPLAERDRILAEQGLTDQDLLRFIEVWGQDAALMEELWKELDDRLREAERDWDDEPEGPDEGGRR